MEAKVGTQIDQAAQQGAGDPYFRRRAAQERSAAARCVDPCVRHAHAELAARYAAMGGGSDPA